MMKGKELRAAIYSAGGRKILSEKIGISCPAISQWFLRGVPADRVLQVEREIRVSRHILRPDIFGPMPDEEV